MDFKNLPDGWLKKEDADFLIELAEGVESLDGDFLEVGSWYGRSSVVIGKEAQKQESLLFCVDTWNKKGWEKIARKLPKSRRPFQWERAQDDAYQIFCESIDKNGLSRTIRPIIGQSSGVRRKWKNPLRFIFIDGCHYYEFVKGDAEWREFLVDSGIIAFHDYGGKSWLGVKKAVDESLDPDQRFRFFKQAGHLRAFRRIK